MKKSIEISTIKLIVLTFIFLWLSQYLIIFIHEYAHAVTAWILGYKNSPFDINYGGTSWQNLLFLSNIDQKVNNNIIYSLGHPNHVALIAFAGPGTVILLFFILFLSMQNNKIKNHPHLLYFLFFCSLWCLGGTFAYIPVRTFTTHGIMVDVLDIEQALHISPWYIYFFGSYLVVWMMWLFFSKMLISIYSHTGISNTIFRAGLMILCVLLIFGYCGLAGFRNHGEISHFISVTSFFAIPGIIIVLWPSRKWVKQQLKL